MEKTKTIKQYLSLYQNDPTRPNATVIQIDIEHLPSGVNFLTGGFRKSGYYLKAYLYDVDKKERLDPYNHSLKLLESAPRFGHLKLAKLVEQLTRTPKYQGKVWLKYQEIFETFMDQVADKWPLKEQVDESLRTTQAIS